MNVAGRTGLKAGTSGSITQVLARFVLHLTAENVPESVVSRVKLYILDTLVVALAGADARSSQIIVDLVEKMGGHSQATVIGKDFRTSVALAALANGAITHAVELDDDHRTSVLHPGTVVIPAALAAAEYCGADGKTFLAGVIAGYEIMTRIGDAFLGQQYYEGFHSTGTCGVFGAAAAAGRIFRLDERQMVAAFGIAGTQAAGLGEWAIDGSWIKRLHPGRSAESGILAALLAQGGFTGPSTILEGEQGFLKAFSHQNRWDEATILKDLGSRYRGADTSFKPYACCRFSHQVVDATLAIIKRHKVRPENVSGVHVRIHTTAYEKLFQPENRRYHPQSVVDAQFSIPYIVATTIFRGRPMPQHFTDVSIRDEQVLTMAAAVKGEPDDEYEKEYPTRYPTSVTISLKTGDEFSEFADLPSGDPENPSYLSNPALFGKEIFEKIDALLASLPRFGRRGPELVALTSRLDEFPNLDGLTQLLRS